MTASETARLLQSHGIRCTPQRVAVYQYLDAHRIHAPAEAIYEALVQQFASVSRTTIYNSIRALLDGGLIRTVMIEGDFVRYDANVSAHSHFKCRRCGGVFDVMDGEAPPPPPSLHAFAVERGELNYYGCCPVCRAQAFPGSPIV